MYEMRRYTLLLLSVLCMALMGCGVARAQIIHHEGQEYDPHTFNAQIDYMTGDTLAVIQLPNIYCFTHKHFRSKNHEKSFWRMVNDVKKTLPVAKDARRLLTQSYIDTQEMDEKQQKQYFKDLEKTLWAQYKPRLKKLNYRQGKLLVRLIDRECEKQSYSLIREFLGTKRAFFWNMFGNMFGVSLKAEWEPDGKDCELEDICIQVEQGLI